MKLRRFTTAVAIGALLAGGLAACRSDPAVAAYVDDVRVTEAEVDEVLASLEEVLAGQPEPQRQEQADTLRDQVVEMRVFTEAAGGYAEAEGLTVPPPEPDRYAQQVGLTADHPYVAVVADYFAVVTMAQQRAVPVDPSEADQREIYDNLVAEAGLDEPFDAVRAELSGELLGAPVGMRDLFEEILDAADITVNPRYDLTYRIPVPLGGQFESYLTARLGQPAVTEAG